jgi:PAS domain S-box-containing protein
VTKILYVDDEPTLLELGKLFLERTGQCSVDTVSSAPQALKKLNSKPYDAIISDYEMPEMNGIEFLKTVRTSGNQLPFILFTGRGREEVVIQALNEGADFYLQKGGDPKPQFTELYHKIRQAVLQREAGEALRKAHESLQHQTDILKILNTVITKTHKTESLSELFQVSLDLTLQLLHFDGGGIYLLDKEKKTASLVHYKNLPDEFISRVRKVNADAQPYDALFVRGEPLISHHYSSISPEASQYNIESLVSIPLLSKGIIVGALNLCSAKRSVISDQEVETLLSIGSELGTVINRMTTEEELRIKAEELHAAYEEIVATEEELRQNLDDFRRSEEALHESEESYRTVFQNTGTATVVLEEDGIISLANNTFASMSGYTREEIEGKMRWVDFVHPDDLSWMRIENRRRMDDESQALPHYEFRFITRSGEIREIYLTIGVIPNKKRSIASLLDITQKKRAIRSLEKSEALYRSVIENIQDVYYRSNPEGELIMVSPSGATLLGYDSIDEILGKPIAETLYFNPGDRDEFLHSLCTNGFVRNYETRLRKKDGSPVYVSTSSHYYYHESGSIAGVEGIIRDITDKKVVEKALFESERAYSTMISNLPGFVYRRANDTDWTMEFISDGCIAITGYSPDDLLHNATISYNSLVHPDYQQTLWETIQKFLYNKGMFEVEYPVITKSGNTRWVWERGRGIFSEDDRLLFLEGFITDVTDRRRVKDALRQSNNKIRLLTSLTRHDIVNNLLMLKGYQEIALETQELSAVYDYISKAHEITNRIESIIGFTREYEGLGMANSAWISVYSLIESAQAEVPTDIIKIENTILPSLKVFADPILQKVFSTFIDNSIRHGKTVTKGTFHSREVNGDLVLFYRDDGIGIDPAKKK